MIAVLALAAVAPSAAELQAFEAAVPVLERRCVPCHTHTGKRAKKEALEHFVMDAYPFTGHHEGEIGETVMRVIGAAGEAPTMPFDAPGSLTGDEKRVVVAWAEEVEKREEREKGEKDEDEEAEHEPEHEHEHEGEHVHVHEMQMREGMIPGVVGKGFHVMANAFAYAQSVGVGDRGTREISGDWIMGYGRDEKGYVEGLLMLNFEPLTVDEKGIPELGQQGEGLWDAQHSHLLLHQAMVAAHPFGVDGPWDLSIFGGQGSATIGPPLFMHRMSAPGPTVPRKHHKGENPHETFPVLGASIRIDTTWIEASAFNGDELGPDDSRLRPYVGVPDSVAARIRHLLDGWLELQLSVERLTDQGDDLHQAYQMSASGYAWGDLEGMRVDALADWAMDAEIGGHRALQAALLEVALRDADRRDILWLRSELNEREEPEAAAVTYSSPWLFETFGFERVLARWQGASLGLFGEVTYTRVPREVRDDYGGKAGAFTLDVGVHLTGMWMFHR